MPDKDSALARREEAAERVREAEQGLTSARYDLREAMRAARGAGASFSAIGRRLGITRQRVQRVLDEDESQK
jgi:hypothetical protein